MTISPFLWFDTQAEEAMNYYLSVFKNGKATAVHRAQGRVMSVEFELEGQPFMALNGGAPSRCGWLKDKFGLSWQIIPSSLGRLLSGGGDAARAGRVLNAMLQMDKLDVATLQRAYDGN